jgi:hypothetical protein
VGAGASAEAVGSLGCGWAPAVSGGDTTGSVVLVCAPPLLLTVTPDATSVTDDVAPDVVVVPAVEVAEVELDSPPADVEPEPLVAVDEVAVPVGDVAVDPVDSPAGVESAELVEDDSEDVPVVSALATPGEVTIITPMPNTAANAPTRPMYPPRFPLLWVVTRGGGLVGAFDEGEPNKRLAGG